MKSEKESKTKLTTMKNNRGGKSRVKTYTSLGGGGQLWWQGSLPVEQREVVGRGSLFIKMGGGFRVLGGNQVIVEERGKDLRI